MAYLLRFRSVIAATKTAMMMITAATAATITNMLVGELISGGGVVTIGDADADAEADAEGDAVVGSGVPDAGAEGEADADVEGDAVAVGTGINVVAGDADGLGPTERAVIS